MRLLNKISEKIKDILSITGRVIFLKDIASHISWIDRTVIIPSTLVLSGVKASADVVGTYVFAKAVELIVINNNKTQEDKENFELFGISLSAEYLLYISVLCYAYSRFSTYFVGFLLTPTQKNMARKLTKSIINQTLKLSYADIDKNRKLLNNAMESAREIPQIVSITLSGVHQTLLSMLLGSIIVFTSYGPFVGAVFFFYIFLKSALAIGIYEVLGARSKWKNTNSKFSTLKDHYKEIINNIDVVKVFNKNDLEIKIISELNRSYFKSYLKSLCIESAAYLLNTAPPLIMDLSTLFYISFFRDIDLEIDELVFLLNFLSIINASSLRFIESVYRVQKISTYYDLVKSILNLEAKDALEDELTDDDKLWLASTLMQGTSIEFKDVWFKYGESEKYILRGVTFKFEARKHYALVGSSSAGKSTVIKLLLRLYEPTEGTIKINDRNINTIKRRLLRELIGFVSQDIHLFEDHTLLFNIAYGSSNENDFLLKAYMEDTEVHIPAADIENQANYAAFSYIDAISRANTYVQDLNSDNRRLIRKASELSVGQKQRVCLARLLSKSLPILVFDEPTASLDMRTEAKIMKDINNASYQHTSITVAHRLNTIVASDQIIVMNDGAIIQQGTHTELLNQEGVYRELWDIQTGSIFSFFNNELEEGGNSMDLQSDTGQDRYAPYAVIHSNK